MVGLVWLPATELVASLPRCKRRLWQYVPRGGVTNLLCDAIRRVVKLCHRMLPCYAVASVTPWAGCRAGIANVVVSIAKDAAGSVYVCVRVRLSVHVLPVCARPLVCLSCVRHVCLST